MGVVLEGPRGKWPGYGPDGKRIKLVMSVQGCTRLARESMRRGRLAGQKSKEV